ncbi:hypothetical protein LINPERHAP2_LOCUS10234 [Linum perenne]
MIGCQLTPTARSFNPTVARQQVVLSETVRGVASHPSRPIWATVPSLGRRFVQSFKG